MEHPQLTPDEAARIAAAVQAGMGGVADPFDIETAQRWAATVRAEAAQLDAVLAGRAALAVDGPWMTLVPREAGTARGAAQSAAVAA